MALLVPLKCNQNELTNRVLGLIIEVWCDPAAIQSESLVDDKLTNLGNLLRKRVDLLGSVNWNGDSTHQSLNTMGKLIANKYREGKIKSTLKKESNRPEMTWLERIICLIVLKANVIIIGFKWSEWHKMHLFQLELIHGGVCFQYVKEYEMWVLFMRK